MNAKYSAHMMRSCWTGSFCVCLDLSVFSDGANKLSTEFVSGWDQMSGKMVQGLFWFAWTCEAAAQGQIVSAVVFRAKSSGFKKDYAHANNFDSTLRLLAVVSV